MVQLARLLVSSAGWRLALVRQQGIDWELRVYDCRSGRVRLQHRQPVSVTIGQALWDGTLEVRKEASDDTLRYFMAQ